MLQGLWLMIPCIATGPSGSLPCVRREQKDLGWWLGVVTLPSSSFTWANNNTYRPATRLLHPLGGGACEWAVFTCVSTEVRTQLLDVHTLEVLLKYLSM